MGERSRDIPLHMVEPANRTTRLEQQQRLARDPFQYNMCTSIIDRITRADQSIHTLRVDRGDIIEIDQHLIERTGQMGDDLLQVMGGFSPEVTADDDLQDSPNPGGLHYEVTGSANGRCVDHGSSIETRYDVSPPSM